MKNSNRTASPIENCICDDSGDFIGLTKREHFAAMAMQGFISNSVWLSHLSDMVGGSHEMVNSSIKIFSYKLADEMLKDVENDSQN